MFKLSTIFIFLALTRAFAQCPPAGNVTFSNQSQVDQFGQLYSTCEDLVINGNLTIRGSDINSLTSLANLKRITGTLTIENNTSLPNLTGLGQLSSAQSIVLSGNQILTSISALAGITSLNSHLIIQYNPALTDLEGLQNLTQVNGRLDVIQNARLTNIDHLNKLTSVGGDLNINFNDRLTSVNGLQALSAVNGQIYLGFNGALEDGGSWPELSSMPMALNIIGNNKLKNLPAMPKLANITGSILITLNSQLQDLASLSSLENVSTVLILDQNNALQNLAGLEKLKTVGAAFSIARNAALTSLAGLNALETITGELAVYRNDNLTSLGGLSKLQSLGQVTLLENPKLSNCAIQPVYALLKSTPQNSFIQQNTTGCNSVNEIISAGDALPVTLISFYGKLVEETSVHLTWTTSSEIDSDHFEIQCKREKNDWHTLGIVEMAGNISENTQYQFVDQTPGKGQNLYRLKMVDKDGSFAYSKLVGVITKFEKDVFVYPNPARESLSISSPSTILSWKIISTEGKTVGQQKTDSANIDLRELKSGSYMIEVATGDSATHTLRFVKQ